MTHILLKNQRKNIKIKKFSITKCFACRSAHSGIGPPDWQHIRNLGPSLHKPGWSPKVEQIRNLGFSSERLKPISLGRNGPNPTVTALQRHGCTPTRSACLAAHRTPRHTRRSAAQRFSCSVAQEEAAPPAPTKPSPPSSPPPPSPLRQRKKTERKGYENRAQALTVAMALTARAALVRVLPPRRPSPTSQVNQGTLRAGGPPPPRRSRCSDPYGVPTEQLKP
jgi:hypothetical protein